MTIGKGDDRIDLYYFGRGHTNGDAFVVFPALRVMHAGDIFSGKNIPLLDANNGGSGVRDRQDARKAAGRTRRTWTAIITGHSTVMTVADLREYAAFNDDFAAAVQAAKKAGRTPDDVATAWTMPAKYKGYEAQGPQSHTSGADRAGDAAAGERAGGVGRNEVEAGLQTRRS